MNDEYPAAEAPSQTMERALVATWLFDPPLCLTVVEPKAPLLEVCRCASCGGLLTTRRAARGQPG